ncbi:Imm3 family immunity protein [Tumebacillus flagellatus]|uniref:Uncharacterized protein n=1 Tax=Tumebacillus flagellatus TaxID=1157490 RepID=A0A074LQX2_9BACL|nr:Imm3 family immunity protein [Tumebacillus flagellatus]KEO82213.1 hypothetical protein EL26_16305 [Tumebacillus flagellatus]
MEEWDYNELREYVCEVFTDSVDDGLNSLQAGGRCLYEFANVIEEGETERSVFYLSLLELQLKNGMISSRVYDVAKNIIDNFAVEQYASELNSEEILDLMELVNLLKNNILKIEACIIGE